MSKQWGKGMTQEDMMNKDECILVDHNDCIVGTANKKTAHIFSKESPRGQLHRAFSVFLFNENGELLLQQRAADKITFPSVWTNTCCSHPLSGFDPNEVDSEDGQSEGVKNAAIRKLEHELGISSKNLKTSDFKFLTRLHYWAADVVTHGPESPWGEHEIDYILFIRQNVKCKINREEVMDTKYVTLSELQEMMAPSSGLLWSPWFRIIAEQFLPHWWADLNTTLSTDKFVDRTIYRFDPTAEHMGGAGGAGPLLGVASSPYNKKTATPQIVGNSALKQGSYGKVKIHKHSKVDQLMRLDEVFAAFWFKFGAKMPNKVNLNNEDVRFCDDMLGRVSRSFAAVIRQLPKGLCIDILIFYLALRALDTIEDDMEAFRGREQVKIDHLNNFYRTGLVTPGWNMHDVGAGDERTLLEQYHRCVTVFKSLSLASQEVIADITKRMGQGMAQYVSKDLGQGTVTIGDYNLYCHFVAGLVGEGLSRLFAATGYEAPQVAAVSTTLANTMGLFLQKTNIIRDYLEDYVDGRAFWPQEVWKGYTQSGDLGELARPECRDRAVQCLNHLVTDALECVPECMQYMDLLKTEEVFRFCAIPQVMAIATLRDLYNNPQVFTGVVKIRKGLAVKLILDTKTVGGLHKWFNVLSRDILARVPDSDPSAARTRAICEQIIATTDKQGQMAIGGSYAQALFVLCSALIAVTSYFIFGVAALREGRFTFHKVFTEQLAAPDKTPLQNGLLLVFFASVAFVFAYSVVASGRPGLKRADP